MTNTAVFQWRGRLLASGIHLGISLLIAVIAALLVFAFWYPYPYRDTSGGRELFLIVISVDIILGPLITFAVFNLTKPRTELIRDLVVVGLLQLVALVYGLWTVFIARPVHLVFEFDRFRVVHAIEVPEDLIASAPSGTQALPLTGPTLLAVRPFKSGAEEMEATLIAVQGFSLSARPDLWEAYPQAVRRVLAAAKPAAELKQRFPGQAAEIDEAVAKTGIAEKGLVYLPMVSRKFFWTVLLDAQSAEVRGYAPVDSF